MVSTMLSVELWKEAIASVELGVGFKEGDFSEGEVVGESSQIAAILIHRGDGGVVMMTCYQTVTCSLR